MQIYAWKPRIFYGISKVITFKIHYTPNPLLPCLIGYTHAQSMKNLQ